MQYSVHDSPNMKSFKRVQKYADQKLFPFLSYLRRMLLRLDTVIVQNTMLKNKQAVSVPGRKSDVPPISGPTILEPLPKVPGRRKPRPTISEPNVPPTISERHVDKFEDTPERIQTLCDFLYAVARLGGNVKDSNCSLPEKHGLAALQCIAHYIFGVNASDDKTETFNNVFIDPERFIPNNYAGHARSVNQGQINMKFRKWLNKGEGKNGASFFLFDAPVNGTGTEMKRRLHLRNELLLDANFLAAFKAFYKSSDLLLETPNETGIFVDRTIPSLSVDVNLYDFLNDDDD